MYFECIECFLSDCGIKPLYAPALDPCVPSPLAGEGQGEGDPIPRERSEHFNSTPKTAIGYRYFT